MAEITGVNAEAFKSMAFHELSYYHPFSWKISMMGGQLIESHPEGSIWLYEFDSMFALLYINRKSNCVKKVFTPYDDKDECLTNMNKDISSWIAEQI